jgi:methylated-DNA-[protein]-cysteine S-methyltransferase
VRLLLDEISTPVGKMVIVSDEAELLYAMDFGSCRPCTLGLLARRFDAPEIVRSKRPSSHAARLRAYFGGELHSFDDARLALRGTPFQLACWAALRSIPAASTASYADVARAIGKPRAVRAVGAANRANPIAIVVPCHRVVGSDGDLTGYGGGLERKRFLLAHDAAAISDSPPRPRSRSRLTSTSRISACSDRVSA